MSNYNNSLLLYLGIFAVSYAWITEDLFIIELINKKNNFIDNQGLFKSPFFIFLKTEFKELELISLVKINDQLQEIMSKTYTIAFNINQRNIQTLQTQPTLADLKKKKIEEKFNALKGLINLKSAVKIVARLT